MFNQGPTTGCSNRRKSTSKALGITRRVSSQSSQLQTPKLGGLLGARPSVKSEISEILPKDYDQSELNALSYLVASEKSQEGARDLGMLRPPINLLSGESSSSSDAQSEGNRIFQSKTSSPVRKLDLSGKDCQGQQPAGGGNEILSDETLKVKFLPTASIASTQTESEKTSTIMHDSIPSKILISLAIWQLMALLTSQVSTSVVFLIIIIGIMEQDRMKSISPSVKEVLNLSKPMLNIIPAMTFLETNTAMGSAMIAFLGEVLKYIFPSISKSNQVTFGGEAPSTLLFALWALSINKESIPLLLVEAAAFAPLARFFQLYSYTKDPSSSSLSGDGDLGSFGQDGPLNKFMAAVEMGTWILLILNIILWKKKKEEGILQGKSELIKQVEAQVEKKEEAIQTILESIDEMAVVCAIEEERAISIKYTNSIFKMAEDLFQQKGALNIFTAKIFLASENLSKGCESLQSLILSGKRLVPATAFSTPPLILSASHALKSPEETLGMRQWQFIQFESTQLRLENQDYHLIRIRDISSVMREHSQRLQLRYQDALTETISHEQLNPLNSIINLTSVLYQNYSEKMVELQGLMDDASGQEYDLQALQDNYDSLNDEMEIVKMIRNSSVMMHILNAAILNSGLIKQGSFTPKFQSMSHPSTSIRKLLAIFEQEIQQKNLRVFVDSEVGGDKQALALMSTAGVEIDNALYEQMIYNVLQNACKFNRNGGFIGISFQVHVIQARGSQKKLKLVTQIEDSGSGMTKKKTKKLGQAFSSIVVTDSIDLKNQKIMAEDKSHTSGVGLGLMLSTTLAKFFEGDIKVESVQEVGTSVRVSLILGVSEKRRRPSYSNKTIRSVAVDSLHDATGTMQYPNTNERRREIKDSRFLSYSIAEAMLETSKRRRRESDSEDLPPPQSAPGHNNTAQKSLFMKRVSLRSNQNDSSSKHPNGGSTEKTSRIFNFSPEIYDDLLRSHHRISIEQTETVSVSQKRSSMKGAFSRGSGVPGISFTQCSPQEVITPIRMKSKNEPSQKQWKKRSLISSRGDEESESAEACSVSLSTITNIERTISQQMLNERTSIKKQSLLELGRVSRPELEYKDCQETSRSAKKGGQCETFSNFFQDTEEEEEAKNQTNESDISSIDGEDDHQPALGLLTPPRFNLEEEKVEESSNPRKNFSFKDSFVESHDDSSATGTSEELAAIIYKVRQRQSLEKKNFLPNILEEKDEDIPSMASKIDRSLEIPSRNSESPQIESNLLRTLLPLGTSSERRRNSRGCSPSENNPSGSESGLKIPPQYLPQTVFNTRSRQQRQASISQCGCSPILIVDDSLFNIETLKLIIRGQFGLNVLTAVNGDEAVTIFKQKNTKDKDPSNEELVPQCRASSEKTCSFPHIELIFMDLQMPVMDGFLATEKIKEIINAASPQAVKPVTIVALTAYHNNESKQRCLRVGMEKVLHKPANADEVSKIIKTYCPSVEIIKMKQSSDIILTNKSSRKSTPVADSLRKEGWPSSGHRHSQA